MVVANGKRRFTWIELVVVIVIIVVLIALLLPAMQTAREAARRASCISNLKQMGLGVHNHHDATKKFPASCALTGSPDNRAQNGWSWLTYVLPFVEQEVFFAELGVEKYVVPDAKTTPLAFTTEVSMYHCPSYSGPRFAFAKKKPPSGALTNYKAIGATHHGSLAQAIGGRGTPSAKYEGNHPDGAMYPGVEATTSSLADGTSNTVMVCETIEQKRAIWCLGSTATLVGLPPSVSYANAEDFGGFWAPAGFNGKYDDEGETSQLPTYLRWDYDKHGPYISNQYRQGPGSEHPAVVNHLFGDGTVHSISKDIDASLYFFIITRDNADPGSEFHTQQQ